MHRSYPFSAFVGQEPMRTGLLLNAVNPGIGGILIRGERGTGKSTAVRSLVPLLPEIEVVDGCPFHCNPRTVETLCPLCRERAGQGPLPTVRRPIRVVDLPLNATEDRVAGTLDMEHALKTGQRRFEPGVLAAAHRGILYVDEVNLLEDHIVDILLDSAAMGVNTVEREGVSFTHAARFILVGTMNPEEGDLRPQLLDRFGLCVPVKGIEDPDRRGVLLRRQEAFESDPQGFLEEWEPAEASLRQRILQARQRLPGVEAPDGVVGAITELCARLDVEGHRADLVILKTAKTRAAFHERDAVTLEDVAQAARLALIHRMRRRPFDEVPDDMDVVDRVLAETDGQARKKKRRDPSVETRPAGEEPAGDGDVRESGRRDGAGEPLAEAVAAGTVARTGTTVAIESSWEDRPPAPMAPRATGKSMMIRSASRGRYLRAERSGEPGSIALDATLRAAAPFVPQRPPGPLAVPLRAEDLRKKVRAHRAASLYVFVVDASGSMGTERMRQTKAAILQLLEKAYKDRSEAALVAFKARGAEVLLPPTRCLSLAEKRLRDLPTGGTTPLSAGVALGYEVVLSALARTRVIRPLLVLVTDGHANVGGHAGRRAGPTAPMSLYEEVFALARKIGHDKRVRAMVIDTEEKHPGSLGMAPEIAGHMGARYLAVETPRSSDIVRAVTEWPERRVLERKGAPGEQRAH